jgi:nicotinamidase/pyrazinamidase
MLLMGLVWYRVSRALIAVDVQNDFLPDHRLPGDEFPAPTLPVPYGLEVIKPLVMLSQEVDLVVATMDWHPATHSSFKEVGGEWPMHCVQGSYGAKLTQEIGYIADIIVRKGQVDGKNGYSGFEDTRLNNILQWHRNDQIADFEQILVGGLATDYCVYFTAVDAKRYWPDTRVIIVSDASRGIWAEDSEALLIENLGEEGVEYLTRAEL